MFGVKAKTIISIAIGTLCAVIGIVIVLILLNNKPPTCVPSNDVPRYKIDVEALKKPAKLSSANDVAVSFFGHLIYLPRNEKQDKKYIPLEINSVTLSGDNIVRTSLEIDFNCATLNLTSSINANGTNSLQIIDSELETENFGQNKCYIGNFHDLQTFRAGCKQDGELVLDCKSKKTEQVVVQLSIRILMFEINRANDGDKNEWLTNDFAECLKVR